MPTWASLYQLQNLAKRIVNNPTICANLKTACKKSNIVPLLMVWDVATYWNSVVEMMRQVLKLHEALNLLVILEYHNRPHSARLKHFQLTKSEWDLVNAKGLQNPEGIGQGYVRVRVRVQNSEPSTNPYP